jgi:hypothetical protein
VAKRRDDSDALLEEIERRVEEASKKAKKQQKLREQAPWYNKDGTIEVDADLLFEAVRSIFAEAYTDSTSKHPLWPATLRAEDEDLRHGHFASLITNAITRGYGDRTTIAAAHADRNIRINAVCPGIVDTEMMARFSGDTREGRRAVIAQEPVGRMARPEEIAATVVWLCSDAGTSSSGLHLFVDGGQTT